MARLRWGVEVNKFPRFEEYPRESIANSESALLTVWPTLERYQDDLVLVGGLAVHYVTRRETSSAVTLDVDFGISLAASGGQYGTIKMDLAGLGFRNKDGRMVRAHQNTNLYLDFLTEDPPATIGGRVVDDITASVCPGINRALACRRRVRISGTDIYGVKQNCEVWVAGIGPLLVLKLNAFGGPIGRKLPKDAYDFLLLVTSYVDGPREAIQAFRAERNSGNTGFEHAVKALETYFVNEDRDGAIRAADFHPSGNDQRDRIRQDVVTAARLLLEG